jgi:hypothetical protein
MDNAKWQLSNKLLHVCQGTLALGSNQERG